jgi:DnaJ-class molecular chaperone
MSALQSNPEYITFLKMKLSCFKQKESKHEFSLIVSSIINKTYLMQKHRFYIFNLVLRFRFISYLFFVVTNNNSARMVVSSHPNLYTILNVEEDATPIQIKSQYYKLAKEFHPDRNKIDTNHFIEIQQAYHTLFDAKKRSEYDSLRREDMVFNDIENFFSFMYTSIDKDNLSENINLYDVIISVKDYIDGTTICVPVSVKKVCKSCNQTGINDYINNVQICQNCNGCGIDRNSPIYFCNCCNGKGNIILKDIKCFECQGTIEYIQNKNVKLFIPEKTRTGNVINFEGCNFRVIHDFPNDIDDESRDIIIFQKISIIQWLCGTHLFVQIYEGCQKHIKINGAFDLSKYIVINRNIRLHFTLKMNTKTIYNLNKCKCIFKQLFNLKIDKDLEKKPDFII